MQSASLIFGLVSRLRRPASPVPLQPRGNLAHVRSLAATHNEIGMSLVRSNADGVRHFICGVEGTSAGMRRA